MLLITHRPEGLERMDEIVRLDAGRVGFVAPITRVNVARRVTTSRQTLRIARWLSSPGSRKKVLILGGGFAGIGAARKLEDADVDIVLVDKHNYHTFQPLLYQVATDLLEEAAVGHPLRDLFHDQPNVTVHRANATGIDLAARTVAVRRPAAADVRLPRARPRRRRQLLRHRRAPPSTPSRCTRSPTRCGSARTCSRSGRRPTRIRR